MYSLRLTCKPEEVDYLSGELWEEATAGIREVDEADSVILLAGFEKNTVREELLDRFICFSPEWTHEADTDWVKETHAAWPGRAIGDRLFLAPPWCEDATPTGRERLIHNPGLACGTGEHPCTQLALMALERYVNPGCLVGDIGTGSGILAIASLRLGAVVAVGIDTDECALAAARENFELNGLAADLVAGSAECVADASLDLAIANINATVLLSIADDLLRIKRANGGLILTGFPEHEAAMVGRMFAPSEVLQLDGWSCVISQAS